MKIQINHYVPEVNEVQTEVFEDIEKITLSHTVGIKKNDWWLDIDFKYGSKGWKDFKYHCTGIYIDNLDLVRIIE